MSTSPQPSSVDRIDLWWFTANDDDRPYQENDEVKLIERKREVHVKTPDGVKVGRIGDWIIQDGGRFYLKRF